MIRKQRLRNGIRLITESMPDVRSVCIGVWLRRGSRNEAAAANGISHFIEHLVFKGTERRSARDIALAMDSVGGQMDAFTSKEYTCFYAKVLDDHLPVAIDLLSDIVQRPLFDATELERERQVVLEEIRMVDDTPDDLIYDLFAREFYPGHPLGRPIQGTAESVSSLTRRQLLNFFRGSYRPDHLLVVAAGNLEHRATASLVRTAFGDLEPGRPSNGKLTVPRPTPGVYRAARKELGQLHLLFGLPAFPENHKERYTFYVLNAILGGTMSSRLFQKIREQRGLVYSVYSSASTFADTGALQIYAATNPDSANEVVDLVVGELRDLLQGGPADDELRVAKEHLKGSLMLSLESTSSRMSNLARQEIYFGRQATLNQTLRAVDAVSSKQVRSLAERLFDGKQLALAAVGKTSRLRVNERRLRI